MLKRYIFRVDIVGCGETEEEAFLDAVDELTGHLSYEGWSTNFLEEQAAKLRLNYRIRSEDEQELGLD